MEYLHTCLNFFDECYQFKERYRKFENACQNLSLEDYEDLDHDILREAIGTFIQVKHDLSDLCHLKLCKHEFDAYSDSDMDIYDTNEDTDDDTDDDTEDDTEDNTEDDTDDNTDVDSNEGTAENQDSNDGESVSTDDAGSILFKPEDCCWDKIMSPFYDALKHRKSAMILVRNAEDRMEDQY